MAVGKLLYCQKNEHEHQTFCRVFLDNKLSVGYVNGASYVQRILESRPSKKYALG